MVPPSPARVPCRDCGEPTYFVTCHECEVVRVGKGQGDYPAPADDDLADRLHLSWWDYHRPQIREPNLDANGRTLKVGLDVHAAACAGHDGTDFECICGLADSGIL